MYYIPIIFPISSHGWFTPLLNAPQKNQTNPGKPSFLAKSSFAADMDLR